MITSTTLNLPDETRYPENGMTTSLGIGINALSAIMSKNMPIYPEPEIVEIIKSIRLFSISKATKCFYHIPPPLPGSSKFFWEGWR